MAPPFVVLVTGKEIQRFRNLPCDPSWVIAGTLSESDRRREKYTPPDPVRPWDIAGRDGETVSENVENRVEAAAPALATAPDLMIAQA
jgi:hypothetical protein